MLDSHQHVAPDCWSSAKSRWSFSEKPRWQTEVRKSHCDIYTHEKRRKWERYGEVLPQNQEVPKKTAVWFDYRLAPAVISFSLRPKSKPTAEEKLISCSDQQMDLRWNDFMFLISPWKCEVQRRTNDKRNCCDGGRHRVRDVERDMEREADGQKVRVLSSWQSSVEFSVYNQGQKWIDS